MRGMSKSLSSSSRKVLARSSAESCLLSRVFRAVLMRSLMKLAASLGAAAFTGTTKRARASARLSQIGGRRAVIVGYASARTNARMAPAVQEVAWRDHPFPEVLDRRPRSGGEYGEPRRPT